MESLFKGVEILRDAGDTGLISIIEVIRHHLNTIITLQISLLCEMKQFSFLITKSQFEGFFARKIPPGHRDFLNMIHERFHPLGKIYSSFLRQKV